MWESFENRVIEEGVELIDDHLEQEKLLAFMLDTYVWLGRDNPDVSAVLSRGGSLAKCLEQFIAHSGPRRKERN